MPTITTCCETAQYSVAVARLVVGKYKTLVMLLIVLAAWIGSCSLIDATGSGVPPPTNIVAAPSSSSGLSLSWDPPPPSLGVQGYTVYYKGLTIPSDWHKLQAFSTSLDLPSVALCGGCLYSIKVARIVMSGEGETSAELIAGPVPSLPGTPTATSSIIVTSFAKVSSSTVSLTLQWSPIFFTVDGANTTIKSYFIDYYALSSDAQTAPSFPVGSASTGSASTSLSVTVSMNTLYRFAVIGSNEKGMGQRYSNVAKSVGIPTMNSLSIAPKLGTLTASSMLVEWGDVSDTGGSPVTGYYVSWSEFNHTAFTTPIVVTTKYFTMTALKANTIYNFTIAAENALGMGTVTKLLGPTLLDRGPSTSDVFFWDHYKHVWMGDLASKDPTAVSREILLNNLGGCFQFGYCDKFTTGCYPFRFPFHVFHATSKDEVYISSPFLSGKFQINGGRIMDTPDADLGVFFAIDTFGDTIFAQGGTGILVENAVTKFTSALEAGGRTPEDPIGLFVAELHYDSRSKRIYYIFGAAEGLMYYDIAKAVNIALLSDASLQSFTIVEDGLYLMFGTGLIQKSDLDGTIIMPNVLQLTGGRYMDLSADILGTTLYVTARDVDADDKVEHDTGTECPSPLNTFISINLGTKVAVSHTTSAMSFSVRDRTNLVPGCPVLLLTEGGDGSIVRVTWQAVPTATSYIIMHAELTTGNLTWSTVTVPSSSSSYDLTDIAAGRAQGKLYVIKAAASSNKVKGWFSISQTIGLCAGGSFALSVGVQCSRCPANYYCPIGTVIPFPCPEGSTSQEGAKSCTIIPTTKTVPGNTTTTNPSTTPSTRPLPPSTICDAGLYAGPLANMCSSCPPSYYCPKGSSQPVQCPNGMVSLSGAASEDQCNISHYDGPTTLAPPPTVATTSDPRGANTLPNTPTNPSLNPANNDMFSVAIIIGSVSLVIAVVLFVGRKHMCAFLSRRRFNSLHNYNDLESSADVENGGASSSTTYSSASSLSTTLSGVSVFSNRSRASTYESEFLNIVDVAEAAAQMVVTCGYRGNAIEGLTGVTSKADETMRSLNRMMDDTSSNHSEGQSNIASGLLSLHYSTVQYQLLYLLTNPLSSYVLHELQDTYNSAVEAVGESIEDDNERDALVAARLCPGDWGKMNFSYRKNKSRPYLIQDYSDYGRMFLGSSTHKHFDGELQFLDFEASLQLLRSLPTLRLNLVGMDETLKEDRSFFEMIYRIRNHIMHQVSLHKVNSADDIKRTLEALRSFTLMIPSVYFRDPPQSRLVELLDEAVRVINVDAVQHVREELDKCVRSTKSAAVTVSKPSASSAYEAKIKSDVQNLFKKLSEIEQRMKVSRGYPSPALADDRLLLNDEVMTALSNVLYNEGKPPNIPESLILVWTENFTSLSIGSGGFGEVRRGTFDYKLKSGYWSRCRIAVKKLHSAISTTVLGAVDQAADRTPLSTFKREVNTLSAFRHQNIITLLAYSMSSGHVTGQTNSKTNSNLYLVYEYAAKGDLYNAILYDGAILDCFMRVRIALGIASALHFLHTKDGGNPCYHRDVKSSNVVLTENYEAKLIDCGFSKYMSDELDDVLTVIRTSSGSRFGTPGYMCPGNPYSVKSEIFSYGVVLSELLSGVLYGTLKNNDGNFVPSTDLCVLPSDSRITWPYSVDEELRSIAAKCVAIKTGERFASMAEIIYRLERIFPAIISEE